MELLYPRNYFKRIPEEYVLSEDLPISTTPTT